MKCLNRFSCIGNIGTINPKQTKAGAVTEFSVALTEKSSNGEEKTEWVSFVAWNKIAEIVSAYCRKGSKVFAEGKLTTRSWETDGVKHYKTEVILRDLVLLDSRSGNADTPSRGAFHSSNETATAVEDDLPF